MVRRLVAILALILLLAGMGPSATARGKKSIKVRVMTFNIRFDFPEDRAAGRSWEKRRDLVAKTILASKASIVGTQEDKDDQVEDLKKRLKGFAHVGTGRHRGGHGERTAIWFRVKRFSLLKHGDFWLSETPSEVGSKSWGERYPHKVTWALLKHRSTRRKLLVLNTHLDYQNAYSRREGAKLIRKWLTQRAKRLPVILLGDFNATGRDEPIQILTDKGDGYRLTDAWKLAEPNDPTPGTYHGFNGRTGRSRIDLVLVTPGIRCAGARRVTMNDDGFYPSDHFPVTADLIIPD